MPPGRGTDDRRRDPGAGRADPVLAGARDPVTRKRRAAPATAAGSAGLGPPLPRAVAPVRGEAAMRRRRGRDLGQRGRRRLTDGPGKVTQALAISLDENGADLTRGPLTIRVAKSGRFVVASGPRIGISRARSRRLRLWIRDNLDVSPPR